MRIFGHARHVGNEAPVLQNRGVHVAPKSHQAPRRGQLPLGPFQAAGISQSKDDRDDFERVLHLALGQRGSLAVDGEVGGPTERGRPVGAIPFQVIRRGIERGERPSPTVAFRRVRSQKGAVGLSGGRGNASDVAIPGVQPKLLSGCARFYRCAWRQWPGGDQGISAGFFHPRLDQRLANIGGRRRILIASHSFAPRPTFDIGLPTGGAGGRDFDPAFFGDGAGANRAFGRVVPQVHERNPNEALCDIGQAGLRGDRYTQIEHHPFPAFREVLSHGVDAIYDCRIHGFAFDFFERRRGKRIAEQRIELIFHEPFVRVLPGGRDALPEKRNGFPGGKDQIRRLIDELLFNLFGHLVQSRIRLLAQRFGDIIELRRQGLRGAAMHLPPKAFPPEGLGTEVIAWRQRPWWWRRHVWRPPYLILAGIDNRVRAARRGGGRPF